MAAEKLVIGLIGNPNCGKTTLFNTLTGARQQTGNWPGVTVERKTGHFAYAGKEIETVDLPGLYSLDSVDSSVSLDEQVARNYVLSGEANVIVNIVDASNLERNLFLTTQLLEMNVPIILVLNMCDVAKERGVEIDAPELSRRLNVPVFQIVASKGNSVDALKRYLTSSEYFAVSDVRPTYPAAVRNAVSILENDIGLLAETHNMPTGWLALKALEGETAALSMLSAAERDRLAALTRQTEDALGEEIDIVTADARYGFIGETLEGVLLKKNLISRTISDKIDHVVLNRVLGIPIFLAMMYLMFMFTINLGGAFIDFFDGLFGTIFVDGLGHLLTSAGSPEWLTVVLANGVGGGVQTVATFIPPIGFLFIFLSILEDSGYMARAAFVVDRFMRFIGLPGKAFVPLIVGFGCGVPAIMGTRTLENERDRYTTIAMTPFMSCGARLPIYALFAVAFFSTGGQNMVFALYLIGIIAAVLTGLALKHTLLPGQSSPFIMELPRYHLPTIRGVALHTWDRLKSFLWRAGKIIIVVVTALNILNSVGTDGSFGNEDSKNSILSVIGRSIVPVFEPMGLKSDNWPAAVGVFTGILAKEAVVGTLNALYGQIDQDSRAARIEAAGEDGIVLEEPFDFWGGVTDALQTIPDNLSRLANTLLDPLGLNVVPDRSDIQDEDEIRTLAEEQNVSIETYGAMTTMFGSVSAAFAYLLFILLYFPCSAAFAAIVRETSMRWASFIGFWTTSVGYCAATVFYQIASFDEHPSWSIACLASVALYMTIVLFCMKKYGSSNDGRIAHAPSRSQEARSS